MVEIAALNDEYEIEFDRFVRVMTKKTLRRIGSKGRNQNHFSPNKYSNYVSGDELPSLI